MANDIKDQVTHFVGVAFVFAASEYQRINTNGFECTERNQCITGTKQLENHMNS